MDKQPASIDLAQLIEEIDEVLSGATLNIGRLQRLLKQSRDELARRSLTSGTPAEQVKCPECKGTGGVHQAGDCADCNGKGYDWEPIEAGAAAKSEQDECRMCNGSGIVGFPPDQYEDCPDCAAARLGTSEQQARYAIDGAIQYGRENRNPPPSTDHWLYEYWSIGQQLRELGKTGWDNVTLMPSSAAGAGSAQPRAEGDERADFEREALRLDIVDDEGTWAGVNSSEGWYYFDDEVNACWKAWQARAALDQGAQAATTASASDLLKCPKCGVDRSNEPCGNMQDCAMIGTALARAPLPAHLGQDGAKDTLLYSTRVKAQRYEWLRDWFLRGGLRSEIAPNGHMQKTTPAIVDAAIDAAMRANDSAAEGGAK